MVMRVDLIHRIQSSLRIRVTLGIKVKRKMIR
jgi:hypothetical protein